MRRLSNHHRSSDLQPTPAPSPAAPRRGSRRRGAATLLTLAALLVAGAAQAALLPTDKVDLRVLVLSADGTEPGLETWTTTLSREGVPFDVVVAVEAPPITAESLTWAPDHARYQAVVLAAGGLYQCGVDGCFSALDASEWAALNAYQARFSVRRVVAYAWPNPEYGLNYPFHSGELAGTTPTLGAAGLAAFPALAGPVPIDVGSWGYHAEPLSAAFTPLLQGPVGPGGAPAALAGVHARPDGFEEVVVTVASNPWQTHGMLLTPSLLRWATRGVRLGHWRYYYTMHIDDVFLPDDRWDAENNVTHEDDGATLPLIRMTPADVDRALAWQKATGLQLDLVFNGAGSAEAIAANGADPLTAKLLKHRTAFWWINHTWSHPNLDALDAKTIWTEITKNLWFAKKHKLPHHRSELVTGEHSGLANPALAKAVAYTPVRWLGSDNSRQPEPYAIGKATTIPRHPSNLYYNVGTFAEQLDEYNWIYDENCTNTAVTTCRTSPATWAEYVDAEATIMARHLLTNDPRPHYAHQNNLAEDGTLYPVLDALLARTKAWLKVPIVQPYFRQIGELMARQAAWAGASAAVSATYQGGKITLKSPVAVKVPVTGTTFGATYGGEKSGWLGLKAGVSKTLSVAVPF
jgi:hypothetical protein